MGFSECNPLYAIGFVLVLFASDLVNTGFTSIKDLAKDSEVSSLMNCLQVIY